MDHVKLRAVTSKRGSVRILRVAAAWLHYVGNGGSQEESRGSALLTQPAETRYIMGANPSDPSPAPFFAVQGFPPASAELAGYRNSGPSAPLFALPLELGAGAGDKPLRTRLSPATHNSRWRGSSVPRVDPASGARKAFGKKNGALAQKQKSREGPVPFPLQAKEG